MKSIKVQVLLLVIFLTLNAYSQNSVIEMKDGKQIEMVGDDFMIEGDQLRYFVEKYESKGAIFGIMGKEQKQEYLDKTRLVNISDINIIHEQGELFVGNKFIANFVGSRFIKLKHRYQGFYVIEDGPCSLLIMAENGDAIFSYYLQEGNEKPYILHKSGTMVGPKYKRRSKKYFADCEPAMNYIKKYLKRSTLPKLIQIYNANCAK